MKIAVITSSYPRYPGDGTAPFVKSISEHLFQIGHEVEVVAPYDPDVRPTDNHDVKLHRFRYACIDRLHIMGHARSLENDTNLRPLATFLLPFFLISACWKLLQVTGKQKTQIIYAHWVIPNGLAAAWVANLRGIPFAISLHGSDIYLAQKNFLFRACARWIFHRASMVTACSPELRSGALKLGAPENTSLLAWGADPSIFYPQRNHTQNGNHPFPSEDTIVIAALGRMVHKKGFDNLIAALPDIIKAYPKAFVIIGGDGPLLDKLASQSANLGISSYVSFPGKIPWDHVPSFLAQADIFILPSIQDQKGNLDGLPTVLLEAMSCGCAVVASNIGGVGLVIEHGHNGLLIPPGDIKALTNAILHLVENPQERSKLSFTARQSVVDIYNWDHVARKISHLLETAIFAYNIPARLGTIYRAETMGKWQKPTNAKRILDVGCNDGYILSLQQADLRVGVDLNPAPGAPGVEFVRADANALPFSEGSFDEIYALDIIEHIEDDSAFAHSLSRVLTPGGRLLLSTPSLSIRMNPPYLTRWISRQWGHYLRTGYSAEKLEELFGENLAIKISEWNAAGYRFWYLPIRFLQTILPKLAQRLIRKIAASDAKNTCGIHGFLILEATKPGLKT